ncbi:Gfo/Idh/MocA family protein [Cohnella sp.]|uniref:Gfo/Idh/MocA family protein n=1 Tax=Cohnella sp. TaxID=1883426 RepID=UPI0037037F5A
MMECVRLAVVGGGRGSAFSEALKALTDKVRLVAVCDTNEAVLNKWKGEYPGVKAYLDYEKLLEDASVDAVFLATPLFYHARQAIAALRAGKHVISEVIASTSIEDSWELVETVRQTGLTYMMAENYCFMRPNMMVGHMAEHGVFGEITYAECGYIHDVRELLHASDGSLTWRGNLFRDYNGCTYPTHSLGPVAKWLAIGREGGDELESLSTFVSKSRASAKYFHEHFGDEHPGSKPEYWGLGDSTVTMLRTKKGALITLKYDVQSARPHNMTHYSLQGTSGAYLSGRHDQDEPLIWLEGASEAAHPEWESLWLHKDRWEHPVWRRWREEAERTGHGGGDFLVLEEFATAILDGRKPAIDVYDAVVWSSVFPLSVESVAGGGKTVPFVDFKKPRNEGRS